MELTIYNFTDEIDIVNNHKILNGFHARKLQISNLKKNLKRCNWHKPLASWFLKRASFTAHKKRVTCGKSNIVWKYTIKTYSVSWHLVLFSSCSRNMQIKLMCDVYWPVRNGKSKRKISLENTGRTIRKFSQEFTVALQYTHAKFE